MADAISSASRPIGSNGVEQRLLDPLRLDPSEQSEKTASSSSSTAKDPFQDYLDGNSTISTVSQPQRPTTFDPADAITAASVYGAPADKLPF